MKVTDKNYYMDGYLRKNLERAKRMIKKKFDLVIVVDGLERAGKSTFAMQIAYYFDPTFNLDRICFTAEEFRKVVIESDNRQAIILDEAMSVLFSRQAMSKVNIELIKIFGEIGQKQLILIVVLPSFFNLDNYIAIHRSRALLHVYSNKKLERGFFSFYNVNRKRSLYLFGKKGYQYWKTKPNFRGRFTNFYPVSEKSYLAKKRKYLRSLGRKESQLKPLEVRNKLCYILHKNFKLTYQQIADYLKQVNEDIPIKTIQGWVLDYKPRESIVVEKE